MFCKDGETSQKIYVSQDDENLPSDQKYVFVNNLFDFLKQYFSNTSSFEDWKEWIGKNINKQKIKEIFDGIVVPMIKREMRLVKNTVLPPSLK